MKKFDLSIAPVAKGTFKGLKVEFADVARKFRSGTAVFAERHNPDGTVTSVFLVGKVRAPQVGSMLTVGHAETKRPYGEHFVTAVVQFTMKHGYLQLGDVAVGTAEYSDLVGAEAVVFEVK